MAELEVTEGEGREGEGRVNDQGAGIKRSAADAGAFHSGRG